MIMSDYISELPVKVVEDKTPIFDQIAADLYGKMMNAVMHVELVLPGSFKEEK